MKIFVADVADLMSGCYIDWLGIQRRRPRFPRPIDPNQSPKRDERKGQRPKALVPKDAESLTRRIGSKKTKTSSAHSHDPADSTLHARVTLPNQKGVGGFGIRILSRGENGGLFLHRFVPNACSETKHPNLMIR